VFPRRRSAQAKLGQYLAAQYYNPDFLTLLKTSDALGDYADSPAESSLDSISPGYNAGVKRNSPVYLRLLRAMTPAQRLQKAFELSEFAKQLFLHGLRKRFPKASEQEMKTFVHERLNKCHNRNY
jgi:hypothetical protein